MNHRLNRFAALGATLIVLSGCSSIEKGAMVQPREFQINKLWIRSTTQKTNWAYRKINRMTPLFYHHKNFGELVIQANAIDGVVAYQRSNGQQVWRVPVLNGVESSATMIKDRLFFGGNDGQFYSVDAHSGQIIWTFPTRTENLSEPLLEDGVVYFLSGNNSLYALDAENGKQLWLYTRQDPSSLSVRGGSKPVFRAGTIYVGFSDGSLVSLLAANGAVKWEVQLNKNKKFRDLDSNPIIEDDLIYILGFDHLAYCVKASTGDIVWKSEQGGYGTPLIVGDRLYYASTQGEFLALEKQTGKKIWSFPVQDGIATSGAYLKGMIVFGESQGSLRFLDSGTGRLIGSFNPGKGVLSQPAVDEKTGQVFFISNEANLFGLTVGWGQRAPFSYLR